MSVAIRFENVSKRYKLGVRGGGSLREAASDLFRRMLGRRENPADDSKYIWALKDVSFEVEEGEALGIIGPNGAGKTTILKLLSGITKPTRGRIWLKGRVSSLIELGAGFHQDLTGRENIYLNGTILGLKKKEIDEKFRSIVEFSELEKFIDTPIKRYSSGMYVRLGFAVAVHVDPEILLVDEVLAVGDMAFQRKCLDRMREMLKKESTTVVFVSHNLSAVQGLCDRVIWLDKGSIVEEGEPKRVISKYIERMSVSSTNPEENFRDDRIRWGSGGVRITKVRLLDGEGNEKDTFKMGEKMIIEVSYHAEKQIPKPTLGFGIDADGMRISTIHTQMSDSSPEFIVGEGSYRCIIPNLLLLPGSYTITAAIYDDQNIVAYDRWGNAVSFTVAQRDTDLTAVPVSRTQGFVFLPVMWEY